jgi:hypothetical protein
MVIHGALLPMVMSTIFVKTPIKMVRMNDTVNGKRVTGTSGMIVVCPSANKNVGASSIIRQPKETARANELWYTCLRVWQNFPAHAHASWNPDNSVYGQPPDHPCAA